LPLPDDVVDVLKEARKRQLEERLAFGKVTVRTSWLAYDETGQPYHPNLLTFPVGPDARGAQDQARAAT
jgi:integrase